MNRLMIYNNIRVISKPSMADYRDLQVVQSEYAKDEMPGGIKEHDTNFSGLPLHQQVLGSPWKLSYKQTVRAEIFSDYLI